MQISIFENAKMIKVNFAKKGTGIAEGTDYWVFTVTYYIIKY